MLPDIVHHLICNIGYSLNENDAGFLQDPPGHHHAAQRKGSMEVDVLPKHLDEMVARSGR